MWDEMRNCGDDENKDQLTLSIDITDKIKEVIQEVCDHFNNKNKDFYVRYDTDGRRIYFKIEPVYHEYDDEFYEYEIENDEVIVDDDVSTVRCIWCKEKECICDNMARLCNKED
jgi:hypothetical protein